MSGVDVEPARFSADVSAASGSLAHALRAARRHEPSAVDLAPVRAALPVGPAAVPVGLTLKVGAVLGVLGIAALSTGALVRARPLPASAAPSASALVVRAPVEEPARPAAGAETPVAAVDPDESEPRAPSAEASTQRDDAASVAKGPRPGATPASSASATEGGPSEAALLLSAKAALASNPERALALTEEHKRRFPGGKLAQEREVIAIAALQKLGRSGDAKAESDRFKEEHPGSIHQSPQGK